MHTLQPCQLGNDSLLDVFPINPLGNAWRGLPWYNHSKFQEEHSRAEVRLTPCPHSRSSLMALMTTPGSSRSLSPCKCRQLLRMSPTADEGERLNFVSQEGGGTSLCTSVRMQDSGLRDNMSLAL